MKSWIWIHDHLDESYEQEANHISALSSSLEFASINRAFTVRLVATLSPPVQVIIQIPQHLRNKNAHAKLHDQ